ncbi:MAG: hypothetical protein K9G76_03435 [Bacteroidales bacterium]|nr:hypothetical protein [Bacteroidales bacterium]MCF8402846.1 hypothetical protein [Bacteroidales bacterium]
MNTQGVVEPFEAGNPQANFKILIASQGSEFKESLVGKIIDQFETPETYFSVIDCTSLQDIRTGDWSAIIIIHTMQVHKMPRKAKKFLDEADDFSNIMLVCTSGGGDEIVTDYDVDAISAASRLNKLPVIIEWIGSRLNEGRFASN